MDLAVAATGIVATAPVMILIVLAIRRDSPGPAFFRQQRTGRQGERFMVYKFRTMTIDSPTFGPKPQAFDDDRLTRVVRFLRHTSLDNFPSCTMYCVAK